MGELSVPSQMAPSAKLITAEEYAKHSKPEDLWLLIDGKVYDVTKYQDEHPGSDSILHDVACIDASQEFADVGHSSDAITTRNGLEIGEFDMSTIDEIGGAKTADSVSSEGGSSAMMAIPVLIVVVILAIVFKVIPLN